jgi:hypothetical protein
MKGEVCHNTPFKSRARAVLHCPHHDASMQCTLLIPGLWWPHETGPATRGPALPHLQMLLARSRRRTFPAISVEGWLCQAFEVERQRDWPVAPFTLCADGGEPGNAYWMRADPLHLCASGGGLLPLQGSRLGVTLDEATEITGALSAHFAGEGLHFCAPHPQRWYVRTDGDPDIVTHEPGAPAESTCPWLPEGPAALRWHRICNEIEMLLHEHPVNRARELRESPVINSIWLWGGGRRAAAPGRHFSALWSEDVLAQALAASADLPAHASPADLAAWLQSQAGSARPRGHHLLIYMHAAHAARDGDAASWSARLAELDELWMAPLLAALRQRQVTQIALVAPGAHACDRFELAFRDLLKFWRMARPLATYASPRPQ